MDISVEKNKFYEMDTTRMSWMERKVYESTMKWHKGVAELFTKLTDHPQLRDELASVRVALITDKVKNPAIAFVLL